MFTVGVGYSITIDSLETKLSMVSRNAWMHVHVQAPGLTTMAIVGHVAPPSRLAEGRPTLRTFLLQPFDQLIQGCDIIVYSRPEHRPVYSADDVLHTHAGVASPEVYLLEDDGED